MPKPSNSRCDNPKGRGLLAGESSNTGLLYVCCIQNKGLLDVGILTERSSVS